MRSQVYLTPLVTLRPFLITLFALALPALGACGGDDDGAGTTLEPGDDGGRDGGSDDDFDANFVLPMEIDAGPEIPGDPPKELADQACAVDTNKLYELITSDRPPEPTRLAVDVVESRYALAYIDKSKDCIDSVYVAQLYGTSNSGAPEISFALDPCTTIDRAAIEYDGEHWLLGTIDARMAAPDVWVQEFDPATKRKFPAHNVTENAEIEREFALVSLGEDGVMAVWVEGGAVSSDPMRIKTRLLSAAGEPIDDVVELDQPKDSSWSINGLSLAQFGDNYIGLAYRRSEPTTGRAELVLDMLTRKGERDRDTWVLSAEAGPYGGVDLATDATGAGVIYSLVQGTSEQLWFQQLGLDGRAAPVISAGRTGGPSDPEQIVGPPHKANDASLAKRPNGFAVAYRALPGADVTSPRIRVHFLDRFGRGIGKSDIALAKEYGGRTAIKGAYDGSVVIGWSDGDDKGKTTLNAVQVPCFGGS